MEEPGIQSLGAGRRAYDRQLQSISRETGKGVEDAFMAVYYMYFIMTMTYACLVLVFCVCVLFHCDGCAPLRRIIID